MQPPLSVGRRRRRCANRPRLRLAALPLCAVCALRSNLSCASGSPQDAASCRQQSAVSPGAASRPCSTLPTRRPAPLDMVHVRPRRCPPAAHAGLPPLAHNSPFPVRPVQVEFADVGCGFGGLTVRLAEAYPDKLVMGMELRDKVTGVHCSACSGQAHRCSVPVPSNRACLPAAERGRGTAAALHSAAGTPCCCAVHLRIAHTALCWVTCGHPPCLPLPSWLRVREGAHPGAAQAAAGQVPERQRGAHQRHEVPHQLLPEGPADQAVLPVCGERGECSTRGAPRCEGVLSMPGCSPWR